MEDIPVQYFLEVIGHKKYLGRYKSLCDRPGWRSGLFVNFGQFLATACGSAFSQYGPGSRRAKSIRIRIHNTVDMDLFLLVLIYISQ
jgi:hypothetical protein